MLNPTVKHAFPVSRYALPVDQMGDRIKQLRVARGMTQAQLATACGVSKSAVSQWESGITTDVKLQPFLRLVEALQTDPEYLVWGPARSSRAHQLKRQGST